MPKNGKIANNCGKLPIIAKFQKLPNMVKKWQLPRNVKNSKYGPTITNNCQKWRKKWRKNGKKRGKMGTKIAKVQTLFFHRFSASKLPHKMVLALFTRCLVPEIQIVGHFWLKSAFLGPNFSRTEIFTAKPMVVGCVQHYSRHFVKELGKSSFSSSPKNCKKCRF